jgi:hypothetical protein
MLINAEWETTNIDLATTEERKCNVGLVMTNSGSRK